MDRKPKALTEERVLELLAIAVKQAIRKAIASAGDTLEAHLLDTSDAHDASAISFVPAGDIASTNIQSAIEELQAETPSQVSFDDHSARHENAGADEISISGLSGISEELALHLADTTDAHDASTISVVPFGSIEATDVQAALEEIVAEVSGGGLSHAQVMARQIGGFS